METFSWNSPSSSRILFFFTFLCLFSMIHSSEPRTTTDPDEVTALNTIFEKWGVSADSSWNISGEPCSANATSKEVSIDDPRFNPFIKCECSDNNGTLCHITEVRVLKMNARGIIPKELQKLKELRNLNLMRNYLTGPLPAFIGNLTKMMYLSFAFNSLSGPIPRELGNLQNLISLSFALNNFSGTLPSELGNLSKLQKLYADSAGLSGEIPSTFANLKEMTILFLSDNDFTRKLPAFIGNWPKMEEIFVTRWHVEENIGDDSGSMPCRFSSCYGKEEKTAKERVMTFLIQIGSLAFIANIPGVITSVIYRSSDRGWYS